MFMINMQIPLPVSCHSLFLIGLFILCLSDLCVFRSLTTLVPPRPSSAFCSTALILTCCSAIRWRSSESFHRVLMQLYVSGIFVSNPNLKKKKIIKKEGEKSNRKINFKTFYYFIHFMRWLSHLSFRLSWESYWLSIVFCCCCCFRVFFFFFYRIKRKKENIFSSIVV